jgi:hypothetical protein
MVAAVLSIIASILSSFYARKAKIYSNSKKIGNTFIGNRASGNGGDGFHFEN